MPNCNSQWRSCPDAHVLQQQAGAEQGGSGCMLKVRTRPECPEDNLRELMWDNNPNWDSQREKKREERNFPWRALRHNLTRSQNKGLSKYQRRASWLRTGPSPPPEAEKQAGDSQSRQARGDLAPETASSTKLRAGSQLLTKSSWDPGQLTSARRVKVRDQLPRGDTWHTGDSSLAASPGSQAAGTGDVIRQTHHLPGESARAKHLVTWNARTWEEHKRGPTKSTPLWSTPEPKPEWIRPGKCTQTMVYFRQFPCRATWNLSSVDRDSTHAVSGANPGWPRHCECSTHTPGMFVCSAPPSPQHNWTSEPK